MSPWKPNISKTPAWALAKIRAAKVQQLKELDLSGEKRKNEKLKEIPAKVFELIGLEALQLGSNQIAKIPEAITQLKNLSVLSLWGNSDLAPFSISSAW